MRYRLNAFLAIAVIATALLSPSLLPAAEPIFSGPQPGERTTSFKVIEIGGKADGTERDPIGDNAGAPTVLVFLHTVERSLIPLLRVIEQYGVEQRDSLRTEVIFLAADRRSGEERARAVNGSLKLRARVGLSPDGAEGPGNFGLNRDCMMTIVIAKENIVTANFALVQPGIADAPRVITALAKACGDAAPPTVEALTARQPASGRPRGPAMENGTRPPSDSPSKPAESFPGAVPTDGKLAGLLREFIRPTNDDATADRVLAEVKAHIAGNPDLQKQARDGWTRVLHFGDRYGTPHARKIGREFLDGLKTP